jgi:hypothetical protein
MSKNAIISVYDKKDLDIISKYLIKKKLHNIFYWWDI